MTDTADTTQQGADTRAAPDDPAAAAAPYKPAHVLSSDPPEPEPDKPADEPPPRPEKTAEEKARERDNRRYAQAQAQRYAEKARADAAEAKRAELEEEVRQLRNPGQAGQPRPPDIDKMVTERAAAMLAQREYAEREQRFADAGVGDYGAEAFNERCNVVANLASPAQRAVLMQVVTDMDDGHKAVAALADDPREAERVLALPPHRMALALAKLAAAPAANATLLRAAPAVPVSRAPAPITPPAGGRARGEPDPAGSFDDYLRWSAKNIR